MEKIWQGHLSGKISKAAESFNASISFDKKMYKEDIEGSMVHAEKHGFPKFKFASNMKKCD